MNHVATPAKDVMPGRLTNLPLRYFVAIVGTGLMAGLLVFLAVQAMPVVGWVLWILAIAAIGTTASLWYRNDFARAQQADDEIRAAGRLRQLERSNAELRRQRGLRRVELMAKYAGDHSLVERIVLGTYWDGQTAEQLRDALGNPGDIAAKILRGKRQEIWKYHPEGGDRYGLWITLDEDRVTRWEARG